MDLELLQSLCSKHKGSTEDVKWENDLCFLVGEKMYAAANLQPPLGVSFRVLPEEFGELTTRTGIIPAPYLARHHWIKVEDMEVFDLEEWQYFLKQSYELTLNKLSKKKQQEILEKS